MYLYLQLKDGREFRQINPSHTLMNLQYWLPSSVDPFCHTMYNSVLHIREVSCGKGGRGIKLKFYFWYWLPRLVQCQDWVSSLDRVFSLESFL